MGLAIIISEGIKDFVASTAGANDSTVIAVAQEKAKSRVKDGPGDQFLRPIVKHLLAFLKFLSYKNYYRRI
jgi:hypothetical protein